jgi:hypothetical protein
VAGRGLRKSYLSLATSPCSASTQSLRLAWFVAGDRSPQYKQTLLLSEDAFVTMLSMPGARRRRRRQPRNTGSVMAEHGCELYRLTQPVGCSMTYPISWGADASAASGTSILKTQPLPGILRTSISPLCARTAFRAIESPRPSPDRSLPRRSPKA